VDRQLGPELFDVPGNEYPFFEQVLDNPIVLRQDQLDEGAVMIGETRFGHPSAATGHQD